MLVGHLGPGGEDLAHQGPVAPHVLLGQGPLAGIGQVAVEEGGQVGVEAVPVETGRLLVLGVVGQHRPRCYGAPPPPARTTSEAN